MFKYLDRARPRKIYLENFFSALRASVPPLSSMFNHLTPSVCMKISHITHGETLT